MSKFHAHRLEGKVAIVTAATRGIGLAIAERLGHEGAKVVISSRKQEHVDESLDVLIKSGLSKNNVVGIVCHVGKKEDRQKLIDFTLKTFGKINILVNNAGISPSFGDIMDIKEDLWDKLFETNVKAGFLLSQLAVPHIEKQGGGSIVFNASYTGYRPPQGIAVYGVTKTTLLGLTKAMADSLASKNIRVNTIAPGIVRTKLSEPIFSGGKEREQSLIETNQVLLNRIADPQEMGGTVAFLVSDDASYITGETVCVTGGIHCKL
ncbi:hypothetical protein FO519_000783 [Halicephalobus sp. NKZ332]|nr:hypothetical protein FO519_000783 [Halicephalobus sp. NKZ332]